MAEDNSLEGVIMGMSGWTWNIFGILIAVVSGYVYLFIPHNGSPNLAMAFFFFIGIIFIIIGLTKIFFSRSEDKSMMNALKQPEKAIEQKAMQTPIVEDRPNKVELAISKAMHETQVKQAPQQANTPVHQKMHQSHSNSYHNVHQYQGPVYNPTSGTHTQHPVAGHTQAAIKETHHAAHPIQNSEHGLRCKRCGNVNAGHAVYCHQCGNRLR